VDPDDQLTLQKQCNNMRSGRVVVHTSASNQSDFKGVVMAKFMLVHGLRVSSDLHIEKFGRLVTAGRLFRMGGVSYVVCECSCGSAVVRRLSDLRKGHTKSCGCSIREFNRRSKRKHGGYVGNIESQEMSTWRSMIRRCYRKDNHNYHLYGGRGIKVCDEWMGDGGFARFCQDMGPRPSRRHTLDRVDNDGDYCPENCRWATIKQQANNKRSNRFLVHEGKRLSVAEWSSIAGIKSSTLLERLRRGWSVQDAITRPLVKPCKI
jgi:hypothetical protein